MFSLHRRRLFCCRNRSDTLANMFLNVLSNSAHRRVGARTMTVHVCCHPRTQQSVCLLLSYLCLWKGLLYRIPPHGEVRTGTKTVHCQANVRSTVRAVRAVRVQSTKVNTITIHTAHGWSSTLWTRRLRPQLQLNPGSSPLLRPRTILTTLELGPHHPSSLERRTRPTPWSPRYTPSGEPGPGGPPTRPPRPEEWQGGCGPEACLI